MKDINETVKILIKCGAITRNELRIILGLERIEGFDDLVKNQDVDDMLELAWGLIANVSGGDWEKQNTDWVGAAERWRDSYFSMLKKTCKNDEAENPQVEKCVDPPKVICSRCGHKTLGFDGLCAECHRFVHFQGLQPLEEKSETQIKFREFL
jgi:hypothetical protein